MADVTVARGLHDIVVTRALLIKVSTMHGCIQRLVIIIVVACTPADGGGGGGGGW